MLHILLLGYIVVLGSVIVADGGGLKGQTGRFVLSSNATMILGDLLEQRQMLVGGPSHGL